MVNQKKSQMNLPARESPVNLLLTGVVCMSIGLGIGYYFGRQYVEGTRATMPVSSGLPATMPSQASSSIQDPAAFVQSEAGLKALLASNPRNLEALVQLGNLYYDHGQYQQAVEWYGKALEIDPRNPNVRTDRGTSYWNLNQPDAAIGEFAKSLEVDPGHAQTLYNLGVVYLHGKNNVEEARKAWQKLLAANPTYPDRAKLEQQLASLTDTPEANPGPAVQPKSGSTSMEDLLDRMKSRP